MLYVSTRNNTDSFTAHWTLCQDFAPDGGYFAPMRLPVFSKEQLRSFTSRSVGENIAYVLNQFFPTDLTGWDVDFCIGRKPFRLLEMNHRLVIVELWHNHQKNYDFVVESLYKKICFERYSGRSATHWAKIAIRIAVLFGIWAELSVNENWTGDISTTAEHFMAAWYARKMGLPIHLIIIAAENESLLWDLVHRGEFVLASSRGQNSTDSKSLACAEQLVFEQLGLDMNKKYVESCAKHHIFQIDEVMQEQFSDGIFVSVASVNRVENIVNSVLRSSGYHAGYETAVCFGAVQDYRAKEGFSRKTMLISDDWPALYSKSI